MRPLTSAPVLLIGIALLAGCTAGPTPTPTPTITAEPRVVPENNGSDLLGTWTLTELAGGMSAPLSLFDGGRWTAAFECGEINGQWASDLDRFVALWSSGSGGCFDNIDPQPALAWLTGAMAMSETPTGWELVDSTGAAVATLDSGVPTSSPPPYYELDPLDSLLAPVTPLALEFEVRPLEGRWIPVVPRPGESYLEFDGTDWEASDGCNDASGKWLDLGDGYLTTTPPGAMTLIGCENVPVAEWVGHTRTAGFDGDELVLFDAAGDELGRFVAD